MDAERCRAYRADCAMHLSGKTNGSYFFDVVFGDHITDRERRSSPPIARVLLSPTGFWRSKRQVVDCRGRRNSTFSVNQQGACAARSNIDSKKSHE